MIPLSHIWFGRSRERTNKTHPGNFAKEMTNVQSYTPLHAFFSFETAQTLKYLSPFQWIFPNQESNQKSSQGLWHCRQILYQFSYQVFFGFPGASAGKESSCNVGELGSIPGLGRSPGEENGCPLLYSGLENSRDSIVCGVAKSRTRLSDFQSRTHS